MELPSRQEIRKTNLKSLLRGNIERYHHPNLSERLGWVALALLLAFGFGLLLVLFMSQ